MRRTTLMTIAVLVMAGCSRGPAPDAERKTAPVLTPTTTPAVVQAETAQALGDGKTQTLSLTYDSRCREVSGLLHAQRFTLDVPHPYRWMKDHPDVAEGVIVVLEVDPACAKPRQDAMPVLYAGNVPVEIAVDGYPSGRLVAFVPGPVDLSKTPIYYGAPELPERVDAARGAAELAAALDAGIRPLAPEMTEPPLSLADTTALYAAASDLGVRYPTYNQP